MIDFPNLQNVSSVRRTGAGHYFLPEKRDPSQDGAGKANAADVVQISADAAMKGRLSSFAAVLAKELQSAGADRIARLKEQYAGDSCPVSNADVAASIVSRIRMEGFGNE